MLALGLAISPSFTRGDTVIYDTNAQAWFDKSPDALSPTFKSAFSLGFEDWKATDNYDKIAFGFCAHASNSALMVSDLITPSRELSEEISSGWVPGLWWQGDLARYLNLMWNPVDDPGPFTQNNCGFTIVTMQGLSFDDPPPEGVAQTQFGAANTGADIVTINFTSTLKTVFYLNSADAVQATIARTSGINSAYRTDNTTINLYYEGVANGSGTAVTSTMAARDWALMAGNLAGTIVNPADNKYAWIFGHSGDIDIAAHHATIKKIIAGLNGGYTATPLNLNISGMNPMDSCFLGNLTDSTMIACGGYDITNPSQASAKTWTVPDGITFTPSTDMPFELAHCVAGVMPDGDFWVWSEKQTHEIVAIKRNSITAAWTVVNANLNAEGQPLAGGGWCQWGNIIEGMAYLAITFNGTDTQIWKTDGVTYTYVSTFPEPYARDCACYFTTGTTVRMAGGALTTGGATSNFIQNVYDTHDAFLTYELVRPLPAHLQSAFPDGFYLNGNDFFLPGRNTQTEIYEGGVYRWDGATYINTLISNFAGRHAIASNSRGNEVFMLNGLLFNDSHKITFI